MIISLGFVLVPEILSSVGVSIPSKWNLATQDAIRLTMATWLATVVASFARAIVWIEYWMAGKDVQSAMHELAEVVVIQRSTVWLLGILTVLTGYLTIWLTPGT